MNENENQETQGIEPLYVFQVDSLPVRVYKDRADLANHAAQEVSGYLQSVIKRQNSAAAILATGNSQIDFLKKLIALNEVDWSKVTLFHMDEYLGISRDHKASFAHYMREKVESLVKPQAFHYLTGDALLPLDECERYSNLLRKQAIDLCCLGIGENGHLAFNDPPVADFGDKHLVKLVKLDDECKMQQVKEGHFPGLEAVPPFAYTLTIPALCSARKMLCIAPEKRKSIPVKNALKGPMSSVCPASVLRTQPHAVLLLDEESAALL
ncbi:MAG: glucosamine-6-phosphate deaminase [Verrucomicrobiales bacterium]